MFFVGDNRDRRGHLYVMAGNVHEAWLVARDSQEAREKVETEYQKLLKHSQEAETMNALDRLDDVFSWRSAGSLRQADFIKQSEDYLKRLRQEEIQAKKLCESAEKEVNDATESHVKGTKLDELGKREDYVCLAADIAEGRHTNAVDIWQTRIKFPDE